MRLLYYVAIDNFAKEMSEIIYIRGNTYMLAGKTNSGIWIDDNNAYLIDTPPASFGPVNDFISSRKLNLSAILLTHGHADHTKDAHLFHSTYSCPIYCTPDESAYVHHPFLLCKRVFGSEVPTTVEHPLLCIEAVQTTPYPDSLAPFIIQSLPGHHMDMVGIRTPDNVFFAADSIYGTDMMKKPLLFHTDIEKVIETLNFLRNYDTEILIPSHGEPVKHDDITPLCDANLDYMHHTKDVIIHCLEKEPKRREDIVTEILESFDRKPSYMGFMIMVLTCGNFLNWLAEKDIVALPTAESDYRFTLLP